MRPDKEFVEICADAFMAAWSAARAGQSLVCDTLERVLENPEVIDDVWNTIKRKYNGREYPFGVLSFPDDPTMQVRRLVIKSCTDYRYPNLVEFFEANLKKKEAFA